MLQANSDKSWMARVVNVPSHGLRTPNEGINQRNLKFWANVTDKICFPVPQNLGLGFDFWPYSEGDFLTGGP